MTLARLYGRQIGQGSLATVLRGFEEAFRDAGILAGVLGVDGEGSPEVESTEGASAKVGVYLGSPEGAGVMFSRGHHDRHFVMVHPNSTELPRPLVQLLKGYQEKRGVKFIAASGWARDVVRTHLGECETVQLGVDRAYEATSALATEELDRTRSDYDGLGRFRVLHFSTSDRQRKGTTELLRAWGMLPADFGDLLCVMDYPARLALEEAIVDGAAGDWEAIKAHASIRDRLDKSPRDMASLLREAHVICQPSRGEAFGLIPLQALCSGVPVVATAVTGHSEYFPDDDELPSEKTVRAGPDGPLDDLPASRGPVVLPEEIASALLAMKSDWVTAQFCARRFAPAWGVYWRWPARLESFIHHLKTAS